MRHSRFAMSLIVAALALAACTPSLYAPGGLQMKPSGAKPAASQPASAKAGRAVSLIVKAPTALAAGGKILSDAGAGLFGAGGNILSDAGAGGVGRSFRIAAAEPALTAVSGAGVQLLGLDGKPVGKATAAGADGALTLQDVPDGAPLSAVAAFRVNGKVYRTAVIVPAGEVSAMLDADPISAMIEARVKQVLGTRTSDAALTMSKLKRVWTICTEAGVVLEPEHLEANVSDAEMRARLNEIWTEAIAEFVTDPAQKAEITAFIKEVQAP